jgi:hypothetical protein
MERLLRDASNTYYSASGFLNPGLPVKLSTGGAESLIA